MDVPADGLLVAHCDWGTDPHKQWVAVGLVDADAVATAGAPERVGDARTLIDRLRQRADGSGVLAGFDFPIGVPKAYADLAGAADFPEFVHSLAAGARPRFFEPATGPGDISVDRPFYPAAPGGAKHQDLVEALGVRDINDLRRTCERPGAGRRAAAPLFWLVGAAQVGRAAVAGWRDVLIPAALSGQGLALWPFDGALDSLLVSRDVVIAQTYPTEFYGRLAATPARVGSGPGPAGFLPARRSPPRSTGWQ